MDDMLEAVSEKRLLAASTKWAEEKIEEYIAMFEAFGWNAKTTHRRLISIFDNRNKAAADFSFLLTEQDDSHVIDSETRLDFLINQLADLIVEHAGETDGMVSFQIPSFIGGTTVNHTDKNQIKRLLDKMLTTGSTRDDGTYETHVAWSTHVPVKKLTEELRPTLHKKLSDMCDSWVAQSIDFELMFDTETTVHWIEGQEAARCSMLLSLDEDDDNILPLETRVDLFVQQAMVSDIKKLLKSNVEVDIIRAGAAVYEIRDEMHVELGLRNAFEHAVELALYSNKITKTTRTLPIIIEAVQK